MYNEKNYVTADEAVYFIRSGSHIHLSSIVSVPQVLVKALKRRADAGWSAFELFGTHWNLIRA